MPEELSPIKKAALVMVALGPQVSMKIMGFLSKEEQLLEKIVEAITEMESVSTDAENEVLGEFETLLRAGEYVLEGGADFARSLLAGSVGSRKAEDILNRVTGAMTAGFAILKDIDPATLWTLVHNEHPQTIAIILSQLDTAQAAQVLAQMPEDRQADVVTRIAQIDRVEAETLKRLEESLKEALEGQLSSVGAVTGGPSKAAEILNLAGRATAKNVFKDLDIRDPDLAQEIRNNMFTFGDIGTSLDDRALQRVIQEVESGEIAKALKACDPLVKDKFLKNMSTRSRDFLVEEMQYMPPIRISEVEEVQNRIVQIVNQLSESGEITIVKAGAGQEEQFV